MLTRFLRNTALKQPQLVRYVPLVRNAFNEVDTERLPLVGPDRLCAEWWLRNGGAVRFDGLQPPHQFPGCALPHHFLDAAHLPAVDDDVRQPQPQPLRVLELEAHGATVSDNGFAHLSGCEHLHTVVLEGCEFVTDGALDELCAVRKTLRRLELANCPLVQECGLMQLGKLQQLRELRVECMWGVKDAGALRAALVGLLPRTCNVVVHEFAK